jgi:hypothetical protein
MAAPEPKGRMLTRDIADSCKIAALSPEAAVLFFMIIPHLNSYGKINGGCGYIKDCVCPRVPYLTLMNIPLLLEEITEHTNLKWFEENNRQWIHAVKFLTDHQKLDPAKLGNDKLPSYPGMVYD